MEYEPLKIRSDEPLKSIDAISEDKLGRGGFASSAVTALQRVSSTAGFVLSIEGPWGSGKTSIFSMMEQILRKDESHSAIIVHYNPWLVGDRDSLLRQFISTISTTVGTTDHTKNAKEVSEELIKYAKVFDFVKYVPGAEPFATLLKGVIDSAGNAVGAIAENKSRDIDGQKTALEKKLRDLDRKIYVFIDDIDRLFPSEVFEMVRIIKAIGHLPNIGYILAWDPEYIRRALKSACVPRASTYIDKIVQVRLPIPAINSNARLTLLNEGLESLSAQALCAHFPKQQERMQTLYFHGLRELLEQPRDINRVINTLSVIEPGLRGEVVLADILGLACLIVRAPRVHEELRRNHGLFTGRTDNFLSTKIETQQAHRKKMEKLCAKTQNPKAVRKLVYHLFPEAARAGGVPTLGTPVAVEGHIAAESRINIALCMSIGTTEVSLVDAKKFILHPESRAEIESKLGPDNGIGFLEMMGDIASTLSNGDIADIESFSLATSRLVDKPKIFTANDEKRSFNIPAEDFALSAIKRAAASSDLSCTGDLALKIVCDKNSLTLAAEILSNGIKSDHEKYDILCKEDERNVGAENLIKNSIKALENGFFWESKNPSRIIWTIMRLCPSLWNVAFDAFKKEDKNLDRFASAFLNYGYSSDGGQIYGFPDDQRLKDLIDISQFKKHANTRLLDPSLTYPLLAVWQSVIDEKNLYGRDGRIARM